MAGKKKKFQVAALYRPKIVFNRKRRTYREYFVIVVMIFDTRTKLFLEINFASFKGTKRFGELHDSFSVHLNFFEISFSNNVKTI